MKLTIVLCILTVVVFQEVNASRKRFMKIVDNCAEEKKVSKDEVQLIMSNEMPTTPAGQCLAACILKKKGWMKSDNTFDINLVKSDMSGLQTRNNALYNRLLAIIEECKPAAPSTDECAASKKLTACMQPKLKQIM